MVATGVSDEASHTQITPPSSADAKVHSAGRPLRLYEASCELEMSAHIQASAHEHDAHYPTSATHAQPELVNASYAENLFRRVRLS
jgi:hypothetical protein